MCCPECGAQLDYDELDDTWRCPECGPIWVNPVMLMPCPRRVPEESHPSPSRAAGERRRDDARCCPVCGCAVRRDDDYGEWLCDDCEAVVADADASLCQ